MKERPILFSGPMVRAILSGQKTVTRRAMKHQPCRKPVMVPNGGANFWTNPLYIQGAMMGSQNHGCPYGQPGDRLWVREAWLEDPEDDGTWAYTQYMGCKGSPLSDIPKRFQKPEHCIFRASWEGSDLLWRPSVHMPRWASRILLEIVDVRVERLRDSDDMALLDELGDMLEDCDSVAGREFSRIESLQVAGAPLKMLPEMYGFKAWWDKTNGHGSFEANPWVWVVEFKRIEP
jgi:hypothetical protein